MSLETTGRIIQVSETQQVSEKFKKREFVIEIPEEINGVIYTNYGKFQLVQNKCDIIDRFKIGDEVKVHFNIKGNKWERDGKLNYITNLDAWKVEGINGSRQGNSTPAPGNYASNAPQPQAAPAPLYNSSPEAIDDLPF